MTYTFKGYADQRWTWPHFKVPCSLSPSVYCGFNLWLLKCLPELWKTVRLTSFQKPHFQSVIIFFKVCPAIRAFFCILCYLSLLLMLWAVIFMFHSIWRQFSMFEFWRISWHSPFNAIYSAMKIFLPCVVTTVFSFPVLALLQPHRWTFQLLYSPTVQLKLRFLSTQVCGNKELLTLKAPISTCILSTLTFIHFLWYCWREFF